MCFFVNKFARIGKFLYLCRKLKKYDSSIGHIPGSEIYFLRIHRQTILCFRLSKSIGIHVLPCILYFSASYVVDIRGFVILKTFCKITAFLPNGKRHTFTQQRHLVSQRSAFSFLVFSGQFRFIYVTISLPLRT